MTKQAQRKNYLFDYDQENDSLYLYDPKNKGNASIELDNLILDFTKKGRIAGIEILEATNFFPKILATKTTINKKLLQEITNCKIETDQQKNMIFLKLLITFKKEEITANLATPIITEQSHALT